MNRAAGAWAAQALVEDELRLGARGAIPIGQELERLVEARAGTCRRHPAQRSSRSLRGRRPCATFRRGCGSLVVLSFAISLGFAGACLVLPFAGVEMAMLYLAFHYIDGHAGRL